MPLPHLFASSSSHSHWLLWLLLFSSHPLYPCAIRLSLPLPPAPASRFAWATPFISSDIFSEFCFFTSKALSAASDRFCASDTTLSAARRAAAFLTAIFLALALPLCFMAYLFVASQGLRLFHCRFSLFFHVRFHIGSVFGFSSHRSSLNCGPLLSLPLLPWLVAAFFSTLSDALCKLKSSSSPKLCVISVAPLLSSETDKNVRVQNGQSFSRHSRRVVQRARSLVARAHRERKKILSSPSSLLSRKTGKSSRVRARANKTKNRAVKVKNAPFPPRMLASARSAPPPSRRPPRPLSPRWW